jgi:hypothetical protein
VEPAAPEAGDGPVVDPPEGGGVDPVIDAPDVVVADDPTRDLIAVESAHRELAGFHPYRFLMLLGQKTDGWKAAAPLTEEVAALRDRFCDKFLERQSLTDVESRWLARAFLEQWGRVGNSNWIQDQMDAKRQGQLTDETVDQISQRIRSLKKLVEAADLLLEIEVHLNKDKGVRRYQTISAVPWLTEYASDCLPAGQAEMTPELLRTWTTFPQNKADLMRITKALKRSRDDLDRFLEEIDTHARRP